MIQHYLKITFRNLVKYKLQSIISIMGLAVGIAFFIFSFYWLHYETSYDNFYPASNRTFLVCNQAETSHSIYLSPVMSTFIREYCPEVEDITCSFEDSGIDYSVNDKIIKSPAFLLVDKSFMNIFPQKILYGTLPRLENELIISETLARQFWKTPQEALGSILRQQGSRGIHLADPQQLRIVGIMADSPSNSSFHYTGYRIMKQFKYDINNEQEWRFANAIIHVMLRKNQKHKDFTQHLKSLLEKHKMTPEELKIKITPIYKKHFDFASEKSFSYSFISTFTVATFLLLCCVLFNFLNLFLNRYYQRTREVKLRKSVGANDIILMKQLMTEALFHGLMACLISGCLIEVLTPFFEEIFQISIQKNTLWLEYLAIAFISLSCIGIILTVPIIQFIQVSTKQSLVNKVRPHRHHIFRRISLSLQLVICLFFLTSTGVLYMQLRFIHNVDVGFDTQNIIEMRINPREQNGNDMLEEIKQLPMIKATTTASDYIVCTNITSFEERVEWNGQTEEDKKSRFARLALQNSGDKIFNFRLIEGRLFREEDWVTNSNTPRNIFNSPILNKIILTQSAVTAMRIEHPIGEIIRIPIGIFRKGDLEWHYSDYEIIGVVKDLYSQGMKTEVYPTIISQAHNWMQSINYFQVVPGTERNAIKAINELAQKHQWEYNEYNTEPQTVDNKIQELNKSEIAIFKLFSILSFLCILISLFGIYSISSSIITQRQKEIAIRKVMGATISEIIIMFFQEYIALVFVAAIIAFPCSYYAMSIWLEQYAYHVNISIDLFIIILNIVTILVLFTILHQVIKTARQNPAEVIKSE